MKFKNKPPESSFKLYTKADSRINSTYFDLVDGNGETKQTKGLALLFRENIKLLEMFLSLEKIRKKIKKDLYNVIRDSEYIEIYAEMLSSDQKNPIRRDIAIYFFKENKIRFCIVIEAKSIKRNNSKEIENQLLKYLNVKNFPYDSNCPHLGVSISKWEEFFNSKKLVSISWMEIISLIKNLLEYTKNKNSLAFDYLNFLTKVDKNMNYFEEEVLSIPAGKSIKFINKFKVHACPDTKSYSYKHSIFLTFRGKKGIMDTLYKIEKVFSINPHSSSLDSEIRNLEDYDRIKGYINERKKEWKFEKESKYRFYILSTVNQISLPHLPSPAKISQNQRYYSLARILSGESKI